MKITTIGIDLAKEVLQVHGVDARGKAVLRKRLRRGEIAKFFANLEPCLIGMEACGSAHHWARKLGEFGHTAKLTAPSPSSSNPTSKPTRMTWRMQKPSAKQ